MIEKQARDQINHASKLSNLTFILNWTQRPDLQAAKQLPSRRDRIIAARVAYGTLKRDLVDTLSRSGDLVVKDLPGTPNIIVTGTPSAWRSVASIIDRRTDVTLVPNDVVAAVPSIRLPSTANSET